MVHCAKQTKRIVITEIGMNVNFGESNTKVQEVVEFVRSGRILQEGSLPDKVNAKVIHRLEEIPQEEDYYHNVDIRLTWKDILYEAESHIFDDRRRKWGRARNFPYGQFFESFLSETRDFYASRIASIYLKYQIHDSIAYYLTCCAEARCVAGADNVLFETIFTVVKSGGYPCGWEGKYPKGRMIVYYPPKTKEASV